MSANCILTFRNECVKILVVEGHEVTTRERRTDEILRASIPVFAERGYRRTSMANIAHAAGVSRPALYQYFSDRSDLFAAAFGLLLDESTDAALAALAAPVPLADQLDGYLQRLSGDAYAALATTPFGDELMDARHQFAAAAAESAIRRAHDGLRSHLATHTTADRGIRTRTFELLTLPLVGLKQDHPTPAVYRRRLTFLAHIAASALTDS
jgi:AcrR family transcriptional regulator